jgi:hypothetical protein
VIPHICKKGDDRVVAQLVDFLKRPVKWETWSTNAQTAVKVAQTKNNVVQSIRIIGGSQAEAILTQAITATGAQELAKAWISGWPATNRFGSRQDILDDLRGAAAYQLAFSRAQWGLLQAEYGRERQACIESGKDTRYFSGLMSAMALIDTINEVGTLPDPRVPSLLMENVNKYKLPNTAPKTP